MSNKTEEQLKLLNEILSIVTFSRGYGGSLRVETVNGNVGFVKGNVTRVEGDVYSVGGNVGYVQGKVENYAEQD